MITTKIHIASDHAGFQLKEKIKTYFSNDPLLIDLGTSDNNSVDYPDFAHKMCKKIVDKIPSYGILICGSGIGMSMVANRYSDIRAALCLDSNMAKLAREHNNANILVLGSRLISWQEAIKCVNIFFSTQFDGGRHQTRLEKLNEFKL